MVDNVDPIIIVLAEKPSLFVPKFKIPAFIDKMPLFSLILLFDCTTIDASIEFKKSGFDL